MQYGSKVGDSYWILERVTRTSDRCRNGPASELTSGAGLFPEWWFDVWVRTVRVRLGEHQEVWGVHAATA